MSKGEKRGIGHTLNGLYTLERLASGTTAVHRLHPVGKLLCTAVFIITVVSFDRYAFLRLMPYLLYPSILMAASETPYRPLLRRALLALPFCLFVGAFNVLFERQTAFMAGKLIISYGVVALAAMLYRVYLCVMAVLILVAVTPFMELTNALRRLRIPGIFVLLFEMTYRYIGVLFEEASSMRTAYALRHAGYSPGHNPGHNPGHHPGIELRHAGSFIGSLLLKSVDRAERIYAAMKCRGYTHKYTPGGGKPWRPADTAYCACVFTLCAVPRVFDIGAWLGAWLGI